MRHHCFTVHIQTPPKPKTTPAQRAALEAAAATKAAPPSISPPTDDLVPDGLPTTIPPDYSGLLKRELLELAEERGLDISSRDTKAEILAALVEDDG